MDTATDTVDPSPEAVAPPERPLPYTLSTDVVPSIFPQTDEGTVVRTDTPQAASAPPLMPSPSPSPEALWALLGRQVAAQGRVQGGMGLAVRVAMLVVGLVLAVRLVYDEVLPRLLMLLSMAGVLLLVVAMVLRAVAEARRQRTLLVALAHLTRLCRVDPALRTQFGPQVDALVTALRSEPRVWPWADDASPFATLMARYTPHEAPRVGADAQLPRDARDHE